jgi:hypothetical protein
MFPASGPERSTRPSVRRVRRYIYVALTILRDRTTDFIFLVVVTGTLVLPAGVFPAVRTHLPFGASAAARNNQVREVGMRG